ncbi:hypothetical protein ACXGQP_11405 [Enterobacter oligotrophicus]
MRSGNNFSQFFHSKFDLLIDGENTQETKANIEVNPQQVTKWINDEWIVAGHIPYSPRRSVPENGAWSKTARAAYA